MYEHSDTHTHQKETATEMVMETELTMEMMKAMEKVMEMVMETATMLSMMSQDLVMMKGLEMET